METNLVPGSVSKASPTSNRKEGNVDNDHAPKNYAVDASALWAILQGFTRDMQAWAQSIGCSSNLHCPLPSTYAVQSSQDVSQRCTAWLSSETLAGYSNVRNAYMIIRQGLATAARLSASIVDIMRLSPPSLRGELELLKGNFDILTTSLNLQQDAVDSLQNKWRLNSKGSVGKVLDDVCILNTTFSLRSDN